MDRLPPAFSPETGEPKGQVYVADTADGKEKPITLRPAGSDPMAALQRSRGVHPVNSEEPYRRKIWASHVGGFPPSMYSWVVFRHKPGGASPAQFATPPPQPAISNVSGDAARKAPIENYHDRCLKPTHCRIKFFSRNFAG